MAEYTEFWGTLGDPSTRYTTSGHGLIQTKVNVSPATVKTRFIDVPHRNGVLDLTEYLGGRRYGTRKIEWEFTVSPKANYVDVRQNVEQLNGLKRYIILSEEPNYAYYGRVTVDSFKRDNSVYVITVSAICEPNRVAVNNG